MDKYIASVNGVRKSKSLIQAKEALWKPFVGARFPKSESRNIRIALINATSAGFGDIIFAQRIRTYLLDWLGGKVVIYTTAPDNHKKLQGTGDGIVAAKGSSTGHVYPKNLSFPKADEYFDMYIITPVVNRYSPTRSDVYDMFKYATPSNVFTMSEYNSQSDPMRNFDFPTGVGRGRMGLLLTKPPRLKRNPKIKNPYVLIYIASEEHIVRAWECYAKFVEMVVFKNGKDIKKLDIVVPGWIADDFIYNGELIDAIETMYPNINVVDIDGNIEVLTVDEDDSRVLTVRGDILPVNSTQMMSLIRYSLRDILLTGDQSITDAMSCCVLDKNLFYQIASWKENFATNLARYLPNKYLSNVATSCGTMKAIDYRSDYKDFAKNWDFRILGKPKITALAHMLSYARGHEDFTQLINIVYNARTLAQVMKAIRRKTS
jgi:hypothetical protein